MKYLNRKLEPVFLCGIIFCFFISLEGISRIYKFIYPDPESVAFRTYSIPDPVFHHVNRPNFTFLDTARAIPYLNSTNVQGWHEREDINQEKQKGEFRIFYVGDSNTAGVVPYPQKMVSLVGSGLNKKFGSSGRRFKVINAGVSSYSILIYSLLVKRVLLKYHPDLVVLNIDMTDVPDDYKYRKNAIWDTSGEVVAVRGLPTDRDKLTALGTVKLSSLQEIKTKLCEFSVFVRILDRQLTKIQNHFFYHPADSLNKIVSKQPANWMTKNWNQEVQENVNFSMGILTQTIKLLKANGVKVLVTGVPFYLQYTGEWSDKPHRVLEETAKNVGAAYLNSMDGLKAKATNAPEGTYYWLEDSTHFNSAGNQLWADLQLKYLSDHQAELLN